MPDLLDLIRDAVQERVAVGFLGYGQEKQKKQSGQKA